MAQVKHTPLSDKYAENERNDYFDTVILRMPVNTPPHCYQTDERYFCSNKCDWCNSCKTLTAEWLRRN